MGEKNKVFLEQDPQQILNIIESLTFFRDNAIMPKYKELITKQINNIYDQLNLQKIELFINDKTEIKWNFGEHVSYEDNEAMIVGISNQENYIKIAIIENSKFKIIDVPFSLIGKNINKNILN